MIDVSAVNAYAQYDSNCKVKVTGFLARKEGVRFRVAKEKNFLESSVLCQYKKSMQVSLKAREKGLLQSKTRHQRQRKQDAILVKKAHIENAVPTIRTFSNYLHALQ